MLKIFAKKGTDEKVMIYCMTSAISETKEFLNEKYGGEWLYVDALNSMEFLKFNDGLVYNGFDATIDRYSNAIQSIIL